jgi:hypothetical protein
MRRIAGIVVLAAVGLGLAGSGAALGAAPTVQRGQYCKTADAGKTVTADNGTRVTCIKYASDGRYHWAAVTTTVIPSPSPSPSASSSPTTTPVPQVSIAPQGGLNTGDGSTAQTVK